MLKKVGLALVVGLLSMAIAGSAMSVVERTDMPVGGEISPGLYYYGEHEPIPILMEAHYSYDLDAIESGTYTFHFIPIQGVKSSRITLEDKYHQTLLKKEAGGSSLLCDVWLEENETYYLDLCFEGNYGSYLYFDFAICSPSKHALLNEPEVIEDATCIEDGCSGQRCSVCEAYTNLEVIPATGHTPGEWEIDIEATCTEAGLEAMYCSMCNMEMATRPIPATGHQAGEWQTTVEPSCTTSGESVQKCMMCRETLASRTLPPLGHDFDDWIILEEASYRFPGKQMHSCKRCGETVYEDYRLPPNDKIREFGDFEFEIEADNSARLLRYYGTSADITLPEMLDENVLASIDANAFSGLPDIASIYIPASVSQIDDETFAAFSWLVMIVERGSYARQFAIDRNMTYQYPDSNDWLNQ